MKKVTLCEGKGCCPEVVIEEKQVKIGEKDNICVLTRSEWEILRKKVISGEL